MASLTVVLIGVAVTAVWCLMALRLGPALGFVDRPAGDKLKVHKQDAVPLGGVGIYLAFLLAMSLSDDFDPTLVIAATTIVALGVIDDRFGLTPAIRLLFEFGAGVVLVIGWDLLEKGLVYSLLAVVLVVIAINAVNLFDGLDGLVGTTGVVTAGGLAVLATINQSSVVVPLVVAAGLLGFLLFNWPPARVFLGDGGSYLLGLLFAAEIIRLSPGGEVQLLTTASILGVFVVDLAVTLIRRRLHGRPLFEGDRSHVYDQLADRGWSVVRIILTVAAVQTLLVSLVVVVREALGPVGGLVAAVALLGAAVALLIRAGFARVD